MKGVKISRQGVLSAENATVEEVVQLQKMGVLFPLYKKYKKQHRNKRYPAANTKWTPEEDARLLEITKEKFANWNKISKLFGRKLKACQKRYQKLLKKVQRDRAIPSLFSKKELNYDYPLGRKGLVRLPR